MARWVHIVAVFVMAALIANSQCDARCLASLCQTTSAKRADGCHHSSSSKDGNSGCQYRQSNLAGVEASPDLAKMPVAHSAGDRGELPGLFFAHWTWSGTSAAARAGVASGQIVRTPYLISSSARLGHKCARFRGRSMKEYRNEESTQFFSQCIGAGRGNFVGVQTRSGTSRFERGLKRPILRICRSRWTTAQRSFT